MLPRTVRAAIAVAAVAAVAACGTTEVPETTAQAQAATTTEGCEQWAEPTETGPVSLVDAFGRTVELDEPARRVAVLEWQQTEDVLSLCLTPVAVADVAGYSTWVSAEPLPDGVTDVGTRGEPNLDALYATEPELVIVEAYTAQDEAIASSRSTTCPCSRPRARTPPTRSPT